MAGGGSKPGQRRGGRQKGTPNKRSLPAIKAAIAQREPNLDSISLQRRAAAVVRGEINKLLTAGEYDPVVAIDWCMKLARIAEGYIAYEHPRVSPIESRDRSDYNVQVQADLARLNAEQLIALKHLALIASGGHTETVTPSPDPPDRPSIQRKAGPGGAGKGRA
jgi:hypothetical protein